MVVAMVREEGQAVGRRSITLPSLRREAEATVVLRFRVSPVQAGATTVLNDRFSPV
jgi:hypothetical protein